MPRPKKLKPVRGAVVRLLYDATTRGGRKFRKGLLMRMGSTDGKWHLVVTVRGNEHWLYLDKKDVYMFEVVSVPATEDE